MKLSRILLLLLAGFWSATIMAQKNNRPISEIEKKQILEKAFLLLNEKYIFPGKVPPMEKIITGKLKEGAYAQLSTLSEFLQSVNKDLETLSNDRHVNIFYDPIRVKQIEAESKGEADVPAVNPEFLNRARFENFMVRKAERLDGNVGYLKLDLFLDLNISRPTLLAAMNFLTNSAALIIDLRKNGGGHANAVNFMVNYFLPDSTLTNQFTSRLSKTTTNIYTSHDNQITKFPGNIPLYILVSKRTSSAAEAFAYTLQAFKRATVIGDTTNGEANPGFALAINKEMWIMIPTSLNVSIITKTNWQGTGVVPDVKIKSERALEAALAKAYKALSLSSTEPELRNNYEWMFTAFQAKAYPVKINENNLALFAGTYADNRNIYVSEQGLLYQRQGVGDKKRLIPLAENLFELEGASFFRIRFIKNEKGEITALEGIYDDGTKEVSKKL